MTFVREIHTHRGVIYLSGGMQFSSDLGASWRRDCSMWLRDNSFIPLDITELDVAYAAEHGDLYRALETADDLTIRKSNIRRHYIHADLRLILDHSDALIIYYDESVRKGAGTISECQIAYSNELPIFLVNGYPNLADVPGWLQGLSTKMFASFGELEDYMTGLPPNILRRDKYGNHQVGSHYLCSLCGDVFEKHKTHFVSKVSPLYCPECVNVVKTTNEAHPDRYDFFINYLTK